MAYAAIELVIRVVVVAPATMFTGIMFPNPWMDWKVYLGVYHISDIWQLKLQLLYTVGLRIIREELFETILK